jgi:hypothetical protein
MVQVGCSVVATASSCHARVRARCREALSISEVAAGVPVAEVTSLFHRFIRPWAGAVSTGDRLASRG